jgi:Reverse transcriptase (RNA-dependent DNA polymerase)
LIAKDFTQTYSLDYQEIFISVAKMSTMRILLSVAINLGWNLFQMNVKNVFLQDTLEENVYMTLPPRYENNSNKDLVCKLNKSIYSLKQSPQAWYDKISLSLLLYNFTKKLS